MSFLDDWLAAGGRHPSKLGRFSIDNDRWDVKRFDQMLKEMRTFNAERKALCEVATETGNGLWADAFFAFNKVGPKLNDTRGIQPKYLINRAVMEQAMQLPEYERLKNWTEGDQVAAAGACIAIRPELEQLYDRTRTAQQRAEELQEKLGELLAAQEEQRDLDELVKDWSEQSDPEAEDYNDQAANYQQQQSLIQAQIDQLLAEAEAAGAAAEDEVNACGPMVKSLMKSALNKAADEAEEAASMARMWGLDPGSLVRLPADQRLALAKRINNDRFKRMADLFGPLERLLATEQQRRVNYVPEEVYDVGIGKDLERLLPAEYGKLLHPLRRLEFYKDYTEGKLLQYELRGTEKVGRGGIVCCIDNSGSMCGDRELWAKAVGLCLLHLSRIQKRKFYGIHFGSASELMCFDFTHGDYDLDKIIDFAEFFYGGGTAFVPPLSLALDRLRTEFDRDGAVEADIVFVTDGMCGVPDNWKKEFTAEMDRIGATLWGINIGGGRNDQPLHDLAKGKIATIGDVLDSSKDLRSVFAGM